MARKAVYKTDEERKAAHVRAQIRYRAKVDEQALIEKLPADLAARLAEHRARLMQVITDIDALRAEAVVRLGAVYRNTTK